MLVTGSNTSCSEKPTLFVYDALHDKEATAELLRRFEAQDQVEELTFHTEPGALLPLGEPSLVLTAEQSNTSLAYGDCAAEGLPPAGPRRQSRRGDPRRVDPSGMRVCRPVAWLAGRWWTDRDGEQQTAGLAMLQKFLVTATDGWALATTSVRDLYAEADLRADEVGGDSPQSPHASAWRPLECTPVWPTSCRPGLSPGMRSQPWRPDGRAPR